jgi:hypothetical protein
MSTLYDLVNVYEKSTAKWIGQFTAEAAVAIWTKQSQKSAADYFICKDSPKDGNYPGGLQALTARLVIK